MMFIASVVFLGILISAVSASDLWFDHQKCPDSSQGWILRPDGDCYFVTVEEFNFKDAKKACKKLGGELASIHSDEENRFVMDYAEKFSLSSFHAIGYIGMYTNSTSSAGAYKWTDNSQNTFTKLAQPTCVVSVRENQNYYWKVKDCLEYAFAICKKANPQG